MRRLLHPDVRRQLGHPEQLVTVERLHRADGPASGAGVLLLRNPAGFSMEVLLDRAMDIGWVDAPGFPLAWKSPRGHVDSSRHEPTGGGWVETFPGGLLTTCGMRSTGMPSTVDGIHHGLHGRVANLPAEHVRHGLVRGDDDGPVIEVTGSVVEGALGSPPLVLERRLLVSTTRPWLCVEDIVTNEGYEVAGHMFRHHFNLGYPVVGRGSTVDSTAAPFGVRDGGTVPSLAWVLQDDHELTGSDLDEKVVYCRPESEVVTTKVTAPDGRWVEISNPRDPWPYLILWRDPRPGVNVLGVEPSTSLDGGRAVAEASGDVRWLEPGERITYSSTVSAGTAVS